MSWVQWLESKKVISAKPDETVAAAARRMAQHRIGALLVEEEGRLVGIFSERDLLKRVVAEGRDPAVTTVGEVASTELATVRETADAATCARLIRDRGFRHLPVVDERGQPVGILSARDFLQHIADELEPLLEASYRQQRAEEQADPFDSQT
jgi:CBS domain-containing protein